MTKTTETKIAMKRDGLTLRPVNDYGVEKLMQLEAGEIVTVTFKKDRSRKQNAYYWSLISMVWANLDQRVFPKPDNFHVSLKAMLGEFDEVWVPAGAEMIDPRTGEIIRYSEATRVLQVGSTSFAKMDGADFGKYLDRVIDLVIQYWMPGVKRSDIIREVSNRVGITYDEVTKEGKPK